jgi:putative SOS response-associated peptidase YedK
MCGRYRLSRRKQIVEEYFDAVSREDDWIPRYNIAPSQTIPVIRQNPHEPVREIPLMRWGLIPHCGCVDKPLREASDIQLALPNQVTNSRAEHRVSMCLNRPTES